MYVKAFNADMTGYGDHRFTVGETYTKKTKDPLDWFHYADKLMTALHFYPKFDVRFCEIEPLGTVYKFKDSMHGDYCTTNKLRIVREIKRDETFEILQKENCPFWKIICLRPPFEVLLGYKKTFEVTVATASLQDMISHQVRKKLCSHQAIINILMCFRVLDLCL